MLWDDQSRDEAFRVGLFVLLFVLLTTIANQMHSTIVEIDFLEIECEADSP